LAATWWHNLNMVPSRSTTTLLVIDVQESVLAGCSDVDGVLERINELARVARSNGSPVVYVQHHDPHDPEMAAGCPGWQLASALERLADDPVVAKSYRDSFVQTELHAMLTASGTRRLVVTGAHSDYCVQTTALSALAHGYDLTVVSDAHTAQAAELPESVVPAATVVAFINERLSSLRYPGRGIEVLPTADVSF
jgi:nicotinamidase-related amidase